MRILVFVSVLGILISIAVLIVVIIKANHNDRKDPPKSTPSDRN